MKERVEQFIRNELQVVPEKCRFLLAVSGGVDSMVMLRAFMDLNLNFGIAHCNFGLRGAESDGDEQLVKDSATMLKKSFYTKLFDTKAYAEIQGISIQMAARNLRYAWLEEVRQHEGYDSIAVAHHQDDAVETFFINLLRGTGLSGLSGIPAKNGRIVRPLLRCSRDQIAAFAQENEVEYREDSSNLSDHYVRNNLRLNILPALRKMNPALNQTIADEMTQFSDVQTAFSSLVKEKWDDLIVASENDTIILPKTKLECLQPLRTYLFHFLQPYGFNRAIVNDVLIGFQKKEEAEYFSSTHRLVRQRTAFVLQPIPVQEPEERFLVEKNTTAIHKPFTISIEYCSKSALQMSTSPSYAYFDEEALDYPLEIRKWKAGDAFYPLGMRGRKKLSDFFTDMKISKVEKEQIWVLTSAGKIAWVVGYRIDSHFAIKESTANVAVFELIQRK